MGLLGSLARRSAAAAMYGSGRLVSVVVPDSVTPWNLRRTASHTSAGLLSFGLRALKKRKKKKPTKKRMTGSGRKLTSSRSKSSSGGLLSFLGSLTKKRKGAAPAAAVILAAAPTSARSFPRPARGPRPSTTKGKTNLSRRTGSIAPPVPHVVLIPTGMHHASHEPAPRFDKNAWARGGGLRSSTDWDAPSPGAGKARTSRLARAGTRKARATRRNDRAASGIARRYGVRVS